MRLALPLDKAQADLPRFIVPHVIEGEPKDRALRSKTGTYHERPDGPTDSPKRLITTMIVIP